MMGRTVQDTSSTGDSQGDSQGEGYGLGKTPRRAPSRPFVKSELRDIEMLSQRLTLEELYRRLPQWQHDPREQRVLQEAIERKRANG